MSADIDARLSDEQLQALASLDPETIQRIGDVADKVDGRSRREVLAMLGAVGVAGGGIAYGTRQATAQPDGNPNVIGTQNDRQDLWADQIGANSVDTGNLHGTYPSNIRVISDSQVVAEIDPSTTTDPVQEAITQAGKYDAIEFPAGATITDSGPITISTSYTIIPNNAVIEITGDSGGIVVSQNVAEFDILGKLTIRGQGPGSGQGGYGVDIQATLYNCDWTGRFMVQDWDGRAWHEASSAAPFQNEFAHLHFNNVDPGADNSVMLRSGGAPDNIGTLAAYPTKSASGSDSMIVGLTNGTSMNVDVINVGGSPAEVLKGSINELNVGQINYEPSNTGGTTRVILLRDGTADLDLLRLNDSGQDYTVNYAIAQNQLNGGSDLGAVRVGTGVTIGASRINIGFTEPTGPLRTAEVAADVDNTTGATLSNPVWCEGDGVYKTSTGTGYDGGTNDRKV